MGEGEIRRPRELCFASVIVRSIYCSQKRLRLYFGILNIILNMPRKFFVLFFSLEALKLIFTVFSRHKVITTVAVFCWKEILGTREENRDDGEKREGNFTSKGRRRSVWNTVSHELCTPGKNWRFGNIQHKIEKAI